MDKSVKFAVLLSLCGANAAWAMDSGSGERASQFVCGGAGAEERNQVKGDMKGTANAEVLFVTTPRGGYLADVDFTLRNQKGDEVLQGRADGPLCMLRVPAGRYTVEASDEAGVKRKATLVASRGAGKPAPSVMRFPEPGVENIKSTPEEKAQARAPD